jgi:acyl-CoA thioester hydrolase
MTASLPNVRRTVLHALLCRRPEHIDELGHVNNAVWVQWIQQTATTHWYAKAAPEVRDAYVWVVIRHEIDYLRPALVGDEVTARTWVGRRQRAPASTAS